MTTEIITINNIKIECPYDNDQHYVAIAPMCKALGIEYEIQFAAIKADPIMGMYFIQLLIVPVEVVPGAPRIYCLPVKYVFGWLFSINDLASNDRNHFLECMNESYTALYDHFYQRTRLYELREKMLGERQEEVTVLEEQMKQIKISCGKIKEEMNRIRSTPVNQLQLALAATEE